MNSGGWIIMCLSIGTVVILFSWCLYKVLSTPGETEHMHGFDPDTPDKQEEHD